MGWLEPVTFMGVTWDRAEAIVPFLILAIAIGIFHVFLGPGIGVLNVYSAISCHRHVAKAKQHICEKVGMMIAITGLIIAICAAALVIPASLIALGIIMILLALPLLIYGGGFFGTFEIISTMGNILSYARIMAIGMASVILALVANTLGGMAEVANVGFVIALGLLVDDSVVVVENISRHLRAGYSPRQAVMVATKQITGSVLGCTATLMFAFLPLLALPGSAGQFIRSLPLAVLFTIACSGDTPGGRLQKYPPDSTSQHQEHWERGG